VKNRYLLLLLTGFTCLACSKKEEAPYSHAADFTYSGILDIYKPIYFSSTSPEVQSCVWDFGDNTVKSTSKQVAHKFWQPGTYRVTLTVITAGGPFTQTQSLYLAAPDTISPVIKRFVGQYHFSKAVDTFYPYSTGRTITARTCAIDATVSQSGMQLNFSLEGTLPLLSTTNLHDYRFGRDYNPYAYLFFMHGTDSLKYTVGVSSLGGSTSTVYYGKKQ
jgi:hypothetical protein